MLIHIFTYFLIPPIDHVISLKHSSSSFRVSIQSRWKTVVVLWRILFQPIDTICQSSWPIRDETLWAAARRGGRDTQEFIYFTLLVGKRKPTNPEEVIITTSDHTFTFIIQRAEFFSFLSGCHCYAKNDWNAVIFLQEKREKLRLYYPLLFFFFSKTIWNNNKMASEIKAEDTFVNRQIGGSESRQMNFAKALLQEDFCPIPKEDPPQSANYASRKKYMTSKHKKNCTFLCLINWIN